MKLIKQEEVDKAAKEYVIREQAVGSIHAIHDFEAGVDYAEQEFSKMFPNGFESWYETFYEIVSSIEYILNNSTFNNNHPIDEYYANSGSGAMYELAKNWTDEFEAKYKGVAWGEDLEWLDTLNEFFVTKAKSL